MTVLVFILGGYLIAIAMGLVFKLTVFVAIVLRFVVWLVATIGLCFLYKEFYLGFWECLFSALVLGLVAGILSLPSLPLLTGAKKSDEDDFVDGLLYKIVCGTEAFWRVIKSPENVQKGRAVPLAAKPQAEDTIHSGMTDTPEQKERSGI